MGCAPIVCHIRSRVHRRHPGALKYGSRTQGTPMESPDNLWGRTSCIPSSPIANFGYDRSRFLGHVVSKGKFSVDPAKVEAITKWAQLTTVTEVSDSNVGLVEWIVLCMMTHTPWPWHVS